MQTNHCTVTTGTAPNTTQQLLDYWDNGNSRFVYVTDYVGESLEWEEILGLEQGNGEGFHVIKHRKTGTCIGLERNPLCVCVCVCDTFCRRVCVCVYLGVHV